jgi:hypothetical protein
MAYKFLNDTLFSRIREISPPQVGADWLFKMLLVLAAISILTAISVTFKKLKIEVLYAYHILASIVVFLCVLPRFFPSVPLGLPQELLEEIQKHITRSQLSFVAVSLGSAGLGVVLGFFKHKLVCIGYRGVVHTIAAGFVMFLAMVLFNPFHLTNLTHTFVVSVSRHAEKWRTVNEWHPAFEWRNPVGTSFPFLVLYILSIGLTLFWLYSRLLRPRLLKGRRNELEAQRKAFVTLSKVFGWAAAVFICLVTFIGFSFVNLDVLSFLLCILFAVIVLLSICVSVHYIYLVAPLTLVAVWSAGAGYTLGRYFYPLLILPVYVIMHILVSLFSKTINKIRKENIIFPAATAIVTLLVMVAIFNPLKFGSVFKVSLKFKDVLDGRTISPELGKSFKDKDIRLSKNTTVSVETAGNKWLITDGDKKFIVVKEGRIIRISKYKSTSKIWRMGQVFHLPEVWEHRRPWYPRYEGRYPLAYKHLFFVLYIVNLAAVLMWLAIPFLRELFRQPTGEINQEPKDDDTYELPKIDLALMAIAALTIYMAICSRRFIAIAAIATCPILAMFIDQMVRSICAACSFHGFLFSGSPQNDSGNKQGRLVVCPMPQNLMSFFSVFALIAVLGFGTWWTLKFKCVYLDPWPTDPRLGSVFMRMTASDAKPFWALRFINENKLEGNMFNYWTEGGFIGWGQDPDPETGKTRLQLFMDGRAQAAYMRRTYEIWSEIMFGGRIVQDVKRRGAQFTRENYRDIGAWLDKQLRKGDRKVWVVLMPSGQWETPFVKGLEYHSDWRLIFLNNKQKLFVYKKDPRAQKLFDGLYNKETWYPDEFSRNLVMAQDSYVRRQMKEGLDYAIKAFELNYSQVPMQKITYAALRNRELMGRVNEYCEEYLEKFENEKKNWAKEDGFHHKIVAALIATDYLEKIALRRNNYKLVDEYTATKKRYAKERTKILSTKRW